MPLHTANSTHCVQVSEQQSKFQLQSEYQCAQLIYIFCRNLMVSAENLCLFFTFFQGAENHGQACAEDRV